MPNHPLSRFQRGASQFLNLFKSKRSLARILSTFLCCLAVVIRPFSRLGGKYAFLILALKELVFSVQDNFSQQLEFTILNIMGALVGIGFSTLAKYIASLYPEGDARGRIVCVVTLVIICFFAGLVKSRLPRLQMSMRISCFVSVWLLTTDIGIPSRVLADSGNFLWISLSAAIICLVSLLLVMVFVRWTSTSFEDEIASTFTLLHRVLSSALSPILRDNLELSAGQDGYRVLHAELLKRSIKLNESYSQAAFELRIGRLSLSSIQPLISVIEHLRRELAWGLSHDDTQSSKAPEFTTLRPKAPSSDAFSASIEPTVVSLGHSILDSMKCVESTVKLAYNRSGGHSPFSRGDWTSMQSQILSRCDQNLTGSYSEAKRALEAAVKIWHTEADSIHSQEDAKQDVLDGCLAMVALLQIAQGMRAALRVAQRLCETYESRRPRLWYPRISLAWLGVVPGPYISDDPSATLSIAPPESDVREAESNLTISEQRQGLAEHAVRVAVGKAQAMSSPIKTSHVSRRMCGLWDILLLLMNWLWSNDRILQARVAFWKIHRSIKHSSHLRHAAKNAAGVAFLTFPIFLPDNSAGHRWYISVHGQWMTISYLWVLETNTGATWRTGYLRIFGTVCAAVYAYITWLICRINPYGLVTMVTVADVPLTWLVMVANLTPFTTPASVTLPPIVFAQYISEDPSLSVLDLALYRTLMIAAGMFAALLMNSLVFPRHCRVIFLSDTSRALGLLSELYMTLSHKMFQSNIKTSQNDKRRLIKLELETRNALFRLQALIITMKNELGLLPKPLHHYRRVVLVIQKILDLLTGLRKVRENIPRKETIVDVYKERRDFMSCVCIALFACQHAFQTRDPLPQFLPSARHAFEILEVSMNQCLSVTQEQDPSAFGLSLVYSFAEQEIVKALVETLEELLELSGRLFGTRAWLLPDSEWTRVDTGISDVDQQWYSTWKQEV